ncbi:MAG: hypothetical protein KKA73_29280 [Chloroflexi bacterium]|nr:hypothetical protein [Chloroflexota bacterium]MBU1751789.1 hypothetical protein [Chloroflexota bacterium]
MQDHRTGLVRNWYVLPVMIAASLRAALLGQWLFIPVWLVIWTLYGFHVYGGGDAKMLMAFFAAYATWWMPLVVCGVVLVVFGPIIAWQYRHDWSTVPGRVRAGLIALGLRPAPGPVRGFTPEQIMVNLELIQQWLQGWLPTADRLDRAPRATWSLALVSGICLWLVGVWQ